MYLNEYSSVKGILVYGIDRLVPKAGLWGMQGRDVGIFSPHLPHKPNQPNPSILPDFLNSKSRMRLPVALREILDKNTVHNWWFDKLN